MYNNHIGSIGLCRRGADGTDLLFIPFPNDTLEHILADMEAVE